MIKLTGTGVNHIMVSGNVIQHQTQERPEQEAPATMCVVRESENSSKPHYYVQQLYGICNRQEPKNGLGVFCFPQGVVRGVRRPGAKMVVRVKTTK